MTVFEAIKKRYSCRAYQDKPVEQEKLDKIFEAARQAPSAKNLQDWRFVVVMDKKAKAAGGRLHESGAGVWAGGGNDSRLQRLRGNNAVRPADCAD